MLSIHRATQIQFTPRTRVDVRWEADKKGFTINFIRATAFIQPSKGVSKFRASFATDNMNDEKMDAIHDDIRKQIASYNRRFGTAIGDLPKLFKIEGRAVVPQEVA